MESNELLWDFALCSTFVACFLLSLYFLSRFARLFPSTYKAYKRDALLRRSIEQSILKQMHHWAVVKVFPTMRRCSVCGTGLFHGLQCEFCGLISDEACCLSADTIISCKQSISLTPNQHHWLKGNLPETSECAVCEHDCGLGPGLVDFHCTWCDSCCHEKCKPRLSTVCNYGQLRDFIIPPHCVRVSTEKRFSDTSWTRKLLHRERFDAIDEIVQPEYYKASANSNWLPTFVFVNTKSGSSDGTSILRAFRRILNPIQVIDVARTAPETGASLCRKVNVTENGRVRVMVAGGDGTIGWVLQALENAFSDGSLQPATYVIPLGTGNDLSRLLSGTGGSAFDCCSFSPRNFLHSLSACQIVPIDRWSVTVDHRRLGLPTTHKHLRMTNYMSIGVDALVAYNFHRSRDTIPRVVSGRFTNKLLFFTFGTKDVLQRACSNLSSMVRIHLDGQPLQHLPAVEGVTLLNIPYWGAGVKLWTTGAASADVNKGDNGAVFTPAAANDQKLEVVGLYSSFHMAQLQVNLSKPLRLGQASEVKLFILDKGPLPIQVDGEPWLQYGPAVITVSYFRTSPMLATRDSELLCGEHEQNVTFENAAFDAVHMFFE